MRNIILKLLIRLTDKRLSNFKELDFKENFKIRDEVKTGNPEYMDILRREEGVLRLNAGEMYLSELEKAFIWGKIFQVKAEIDLLNNAKKKYDEAVNYNPKKSNMKVMYEKTTKLLKIIN
ncbi:MAG: hypothetical protein HQ538_01770 [Parcubacteria group bacterium]|nr:hypothetical protein [Parcubacteria group bacterium]